MGINQHNYPGTGINKKSLFFSAESLRCFSRNPLEFTMDFHVKFDGRGVPAYVAEVGALLGG